MTLIIGLGHKARQGKDTVANFWKELLPEYVTLYSFADELKTYCRDHHDDLEWKWQLAHQTKAKPVFKDDPIYGCTPILQWYGTQVVRKENPNHWIDIVASKIRREQPIIAIIRDVRFPNEAAYVKQNAGILVDVRRYNADGTQYLDTTRDPKHESETALDNYDWDISLEAQSGELEELKQDAFSFMYDTLFQTGFCIVPSGFDVDSPFKLEPCTEKDAVAQGDGCGE